MIGRGAGKLGELSRHDENYDCVRLIDEGCLYNF
jgi:hypothetical protein